MLESPPTKKCIACAKGIEEAATLCEICGTHQHWFKRLVSAFGAYLAVIITLVSIAGMLWPLLTSIWLTNSDITISAPYLHDNLIVMSVFNQGHKHGFITDAILLLSNGDKCSGDNVNQLSQNLKESFSDQEKLVYSNDDFTICENSLSVQLHDEELQMPVVVKKGQLRIFKLHVSPNENNIDDWCEDALNSNFSRWLLVRYKNVESLPESKIFALSINDIPKSLIQNEK